LFESIESKKSLFKKILFVTGPIMIAYLSFAGYPYEAPSAPIQLLLVAFDENWALCPHAASM